MKIGMVCYPTFGGSGVVATELGKALVKKGHEVHFITYSQPFRLDYVSDKLVYHEVSMVDYPLFDYPPYELNLASKLVDVVRHAGLDLLHVHYAIPHAAAAYMAREILRAEGIYVPFITTLHGTDITLLGKDESYEPVITFAMNQSDGLTAVSESLKKDTLDHFKVSKEIRVIPNFIDINAYSKIETSELRNTYAPYGEKILIHVSNFRKVKRVDDVLRIFDKVRKRIPTRLILVGDGPERGNIEKLCRELDTCNEIKFLGKVTSPEKILSAADLFILPSEFESFGLSALEAMASRVPVISSNTGGIPEVNVHGYSGFLSKVGDVEDMAENAYRILSDIALHSKMKENAFQQASNFDIAKVLPIYESYYREVLEKSGMAAIK